MTQILTNRVKAIKNTPDTGEQVQIAEINAAFDKLDNHFIPACKIRHTNQSINHNTFTTSQFSITTLDTYAARSEGPMADLVNDKIIIRKAGIYLLRFNNLWLAGTAGGVVRSDLMKNGNPNNAVFDPGPAGAISQVVQHFELLAVNDEISARVFQTSGVARSVDFNTYDHVLELSAIWMGAGVEV